MAKAPLITAGVIFALIALIHVSRVFFQFPIVISNYPIPLSANIIAFIIFGLLSFWMFTSAKE